MDHRLEERLEELKKLPKNPLHRKATEDDELERTYLMILAFYDENSRTPTLRELGRLLGWKSHHPAKSRVQRLHDEGSLELVIERQKTTIKLPKA